MPRDKSIWLAFFLLVPVTLLIRAVSTGPEVIEKRLAASVGEPRAQEERARRWSTVSLRRRSSIGEGELVKAFRIRIGEGGHVYVLDLGDRCVKRFEPHGVLVSTYCAPATNTSPEDGGRPTPSDFALDPRGRIWVTYLTENVIRLFAPEGQLERTLATDSFPHRIEIDPSGRLVVMSGLPGRHIFRRYDANGEPAGEFGRLLEEEQSPPVLDGWIAAARDSRLVYAPLHAGLLAVFSTAGELDYLVEGIDPGGFPRLVTTREGRQRVEPGTPFKNLDVNVWGECVFVLSERPQGIGQERAIDVYSLDEGSYLHSLRLPEPYHHALVIGDHLYGVRQGRVAVWQIEAPGTSLTRCAPEADAAV